MMKLSRKGMAQLQSILEDHDKICGLSKGDNGWLYDHDNMKVKRACLHLPGFKIESVHFSVTLEYPLQGGRLSKSDVGLCDFLRDSKHSTLGHLANVLRHRYSSKDGKRLTASHLSNFLRKELGIRRMAKCRKPNYQGKN